MTHTPRAIRVCTWCASTFDYAPVGGRKRDYCPRCYPLRTRMVCGPWQSVAIVRPCNWCGSLFVSKNVTTKVCSRKCRALTLQARGSPVCKVGQCSVCKVLLPGKTAGVRKCNDCRATVKAKKHAQRRQADAAGVAVDGERVTVEKLAARDGECCWLCSKPVDLALARNTRMGATVDHVVPIIHGGITTMANSRLAHLVCNAKRRHDAPESTQLRLVG